MPGMLAPGDMERIAKFSTGLDPESIAEEIQGNTDDLNILNQANDVISWIETHFAASPGAMVLARDGKTYQIPTIVPAQKEDGSCVFLDENDRCTIHPVSPFGCQQFKICEEDPMLIKGGQDKVSHCLSAIAVDEQYMMAHAMLQAEGLVPKPLPERKKDLLRLIQEAEEDDS